MIKQFLKYTLITLLLSLSCSLTHAASGHLFKVVSSGGTSINITLCLNIKGKSPISCENHTTQSGTLTINTTIPKHTYYTAGIRVNTPGYAYTSLAMLKKSMRSGSFNNTQNLAGGFISLGPVSSTQATQGGLEPTTNSPPKIVKQPADQTVTVGQTATFSVVATGTTPLSYQWSRDGILLPNGTSSSYTIPDTTTKDNGASFTVVVKNALGSVTSNAAILTVKSTGDAPSIIIQPADQTVSVGQAATFSVVATGTTPLSYQWSRDGAPLADGTSSSYTIPDTTTKDNGASFTVVVKNALGSATSKAAVLTVTSIAGAPSIIKQPGDQTVTAGQTATFSIVATGTEPLSYQWSMYGKAIPGATSSSYTTPATTTADNGSPFTVQVKNSIGIVASNAAILTVTSPPGAPSITTQPENQTVTAGKTATFSVVATGTEPLSYQWSLDGKIIPGATSSSYTTPATTKADNGTSFTVEVKNAISSVTSNAAILTVNSPEDAPSIIIQPADQTVSVGQTATFSVLVTGTEPFSYQWSMNGTPIPDATSSSYTTSATTTGDNGVSFKVLVKNAIGVVTSNAAVLTVTSTAGAPNIIKQPADQTVSVGQTVTFSVVVTGTDPLSYQWSQYGKLIPGANLSSYSIPATSAKDDGTPFTVEVKNAIGVVTSNAAILTVKSTEEAPNITTQPINQTVTVGEKATFSVVATGTEPLSYQWKKNGGSITGATSESYTTPPAGATDNGASFTVVVTNAVGSALSEEAILTVNPAFPNIAKQPVNQTVTAGQTATFLVVATGTAPLKYQWQKDGVAITGATSASYTTPATVLSDDKTSFTVVVTNDLGSAPSNTATLTVNPALAAAAVGFGSMSYTTSDSGTNWVASKTPPSGVNQLQGIACSLNGKICTAVGFSGSTLLSYTSNNGGIDWSPSPTPPSGNGQLYGVACSDDVQTCTAVGSNGSTLLSYTSNNGGDSWNTSTIPPSGSGQLSAVACFNNGQACTAVGFNGSTPLSYNSNNSGDSWDTSTFSLSGGGQLYGVACSNSGQCAAVGFDGTVPLGYNSSNGGVDWTTSTFSGGGGQLYGVACSDSGKCTAVGNSLSYISIDGGANWTKSLTSFVGTEIYGVTCSSSGLICIAVGFKGGGAVSYTSSNGGDTWTISKTPPSGTTKLYDVAMAKS